MSDLKDTKFTGMKEIIRLYVVDRFTQEPRLEKEWDTKFKSGDTEVQRSIDDLVGYLYSEAAKLPREGNCTAVEDKVVFGWVNHYLEEEGREVVSNRNSTRTQEGNSTEPEDKKEIKSTTTKPTVEKKPKKEKKKPEEQGTQLALFSML